MANILKGALDMTGLILACIVCFQVYDYSRAYDQCKGIKSASKQQQCVLKKSVLK
jgi:hypothetical protein